MARDWIPWGLSGEVKGKLNRHIGNSVYRDVPQDDIRAAEQKYGKDELAFRMAGTQDKKSRAYKSARDRLTRIRNGKVRTPKAATVNSVNRAAKKSRTDELRKRSSISVSCVADVKTSRTTWERGNIKATLSGDALEEFLTALDKGDQEGALQIMCDEYGLDPDYVEDITDVTNFHME